MEKTIEIEREVVSSSGARTLIGCGKTAFYRTHIHKIEKAGKLGATVCFYKDEIESYVKTLKSPLKGVRLVTV